MADLDRLSRRLPERGRLIEGKEGPGSSRSCDSGTFVDRIRCYRKGCLPGRFCGCVLSHPKIGDHMNELKDLGLDVETIRRVMGIPPRRPGLLELALMPRLAVF